MPVTEKLLELYNVEQQIRSLKTRVQAAQRYSDAQKKQLAELNKRRETSAVQCRQLEALAGNIETDVQSIEERMTSLREKMNNATSSKEYNALLTELNTLKADKGLLETNALEEMTKVDAIREQIAQLDEEIANRASVCEVADRNLATENAEIADRLGELEQKRDALIPGIPREAMTQFRELAHWHDGEAMAAVIEQDRRRQEYICEACNMEVPIEVVSILLSRGDIAICPSCKRILHLHAQARESLQK